MLIVISKEGLPTIAFATKLRVGGVAFVIFFHRLRESLNDRFPQCGVNNVEASMRKILSYEIEI